MKRAHTHMKAVEKEMAAMKEGGKTNREIAEHFGFEDKYVAKRWVSRYNRRKKLVEASIQPGRRGRPPKGHLSSEAEKDNEIKRMKMGIALLRDFLRAAGWLDC